MYIQTTVEADFKFKVKDGNNNTYKWEVSIDEGIAMQMNVNIHNNGQIFDADQHGGGCAYPIREHNGSIQVYYNGWNAPSEEFLRAYSDYKSEKILLEEKGSK